MLLSAPDSSLHGHGHGPDTVQLHGSLNVGTLRLYYLVHALPYTPSWRFVKERMTGRSAPSWRSARTWRSGPGYAGLTFRAVCGQRLRDQDGFHGELADAGLPFVMALKPRRGT